MYIEKQMSSRKLYIRLNSNGLYVLNNESASGKTYLAKLLSALDGEFSVTYNEVKGILDANITEAFSGKYKIVMFDRFDMYCTQELYDKCVRYSKDMVILLDLKCYFAYCKVVPRPAQVILDSEVIALV